MNDAAVRELAQSDPTANLTEQWGRIAAKARTRIEELSTILRGLDAIQTQLAERGLTATVDLGPIGNAAAAARRDLEKQRDQPTFELPRV